MNALGGDICNLFQSKIIVFQPALVHARPLAPRDVYRCEQRSAAWAYRWLASSLSLPVSDSCGETGGKLALTSLWVRVSKCCSHYKRPQDDCGNKVAEKNISSCFSQIGARVRVAEIVFFFLHSHEVAALVFWKRTLCLELQGGNKISVKSKPKPGLLSVACGPPRPSPPPLRVSLFMKRFFFHHTKTFFYCVYSQPTQVESLSSECAAQLYRQLYQGTLQC